MSFKLSNLKQIDPSQSQFQTITYTTSSGLAFITLNRPSRLNAIIYPMNLEINQAVILANNDDTVKVIIVKGAGNNFCSGYDLKEYAEKPRGTVEGCQTMPWDPYLDYRFVNEFTECFMSLWKSYKPTIAQIEGYAIAGGSDIALCCDIIVMAEDAKIGYPPGRLWGCPTTFMWVYKIGAEAAKNMLFTGKTITGKEAKAIGLVSHCVKKDQLENAVLDLANNIKLVPSNQLFFSKMIINDAVERMGLLSTQKMGTFFDGYTRHTPEGVEFQKKCNEVGFKQAVKERDEPNNKMKPKF